MMTRRILINCGIGRIIRFWYTRILRAYGEDCFKFTDNFIRITLPISEQDGTQSAPS